MCLAGNVGPWFPCFLEDTASSLLCHVPLPQTRAPWESKGSWNHVVSADGALYGGCGAVRSPVQAPLKGNSFSLHQS